MNKIKPLERQHYFEANPRITPKTVVATILMLIVVAVMGIIGFALLTQKMAPVPAGLSILILVILGWYIAGKADGVL